ncbi:hypothetical protein Tco_1073829 [Tanacetum coccineum]
MGSYTLQQLRGYSFDELKSLFEATMRRVKTFDPIESEVDKAVPELATESSKRDAEEELDQESSKRQKTGESSKLAEEPREKEDDELDDLVKLWSLVKERFTSTKPTNDKERDIWVELKRLFEPDIDDELWKLQKHIHNLTWKLYDSCKVHHVSTEKGIDIYMLIMKCLENFLGRYPCRLKDQEDKVFGRILSRFNSRNLMIWSAARERKIVEIDQDPGISLVQHDVEIQGRYEHDMEFEIDFNAAKKVSTTEKDVSTVELVSTAGAIITTDSVAVSTASPTRNTRVSTTDDITMAKIPVYIRKSAAKHKEKDCKLNLRKNRGKGLPGLQIDEREKYTEVEQARMLVELINQRKRYFAAQRAKERRKNPPTQAQQRTYMSNYIKHIGSHILQQLRGYSFDKIKTLFKITMRRINTFVLIESKVDRAVPELATGSSKRDA